LKIEIVVLKINNSLTKNNSDSVGVGVVHGGGGSKKAKRQKEMVKQDGNRVVVVPVSGNQVVVVTVSVWLA
jgi:hypothetical protein